MQQTLIKIILEWVIIITVYDKFTLEKRKTTLGDQSVLKQLEIMNVLYMSGKCESSKSREMTFCCFFFILPFLSLKLHLSVGL